MLCFPKYSIIEYLCSLVNNSTLPLLWNYTHISVYLGKSGTQIQNRWYRTDGETNDLFRGEWLKRQTSRVMLHRAKIPCLLLSAEITYINYSPWQQHNQLREVFDFWGQMELSPGGYRIQEEKDSLCWSPGHKSYLLRAKPSCLERVKKKSIAATLILGHTSHHIQSEARVLRVPAEVNKLISRREMWLYQHRAGRSRQQTRNEENSLSAILFFIL